MDHQPEKEVKKEQPDFFSQLMFGAPIQPIESESGDHNRKKERKQQSNHIDYSKLMEQVDDIVTKLVELKPVINEISPIIGQIKKFFKE